MSNASSLPARFSDIHSSDPSPHAPPAAVRRSHIIQISDEHIPFPNSNAAAAYEMLHTTQPYGVVHAGDKFQLEPDRTSPFGASRSAFPLTMGWLCYLDLANQRRALGEMWEIDLDGNHDQRKMQGDVLARSSEVGINAARAVLYGDQGVALHSHQNDSRYVNDFLNLVCSSQSEKLVSQSERAFAIGHHVSKTFLAAQDYRASFTGTAWKFGVSTFNKGHDHNPREAFIYDPPFASLRPKDFAKRALMSSFLAAIPAIKLAVPPIVRGVGSNLYQNHVAPPLTRLFNGAAVRKPLKALFGEKAIRITDAIAGAILTFAAAKPDLAIVKHVHVGRMKPPDQAYIPDGSKKILGITKIVSSAWTEGLNTYQEIDAHGHATLKRWDAETRASYGLPEASPTEEEIVARHFAEFGGFHPKTIEQLEFLLDGETGLLGDATPEAIRDFSRMPERGDAWQVLLRGENDAPVLLPAEGAELQTIPIAAPIPPRALESILACIDQRIEFSPGAAMPARDYGYDPDEEEDEPAGIGPPLMAPGWS